MFVWWLWMTLEMQELWHSQHGAKRFLSLLLIWAWADLIFDMQLFGPSPSLMGYCHICSIWYACLVTTAAEFWASVKTCLILKDLKISVLQWTLETCHDLFHLWMIAILWEYQLSEYMIITAWDTLTRHHNCYKFTMELGKKKTQMTPAGDSSF